MVQSVDQRTTCSRRTPSLAGSTTSATRAASPTGHARRTSNSTTGTCGAPTPMMWTADLALAMTPPTARPSPPRPPQPRTAAIRLASTARSQVMDTKRTSSTAGGIGCVNFTEIHVTICAQMLMMVLAQCCTTPPRSIMDKLLDVTMPTKPSAMADPYVMSVATCVKTRPPLNLLPVFLTTRSLNAKIWVLDGILTRITAG